MSYLKGENLRRRKIVLKNKKRFFIVIFTMVFVLLTIFLIAILNKTPALDKNTKIVLESTETTILNSVNPLIKTKSVKAETNKSVYNKKISMPKKHQEYLYKRCVELHLNYKKTLAFIKNESQFNNMSIGVNSDKDILTTSSRGSIERKVKSLNLKNLNNGEMKTIYLGSFNKYYYSKLNSKTKRYYFSQIINADYGYFQINTINHKSLAKKLKTQINPLDPYINIDWGTHILASYYKAYKLAGYKGNRLDEAVWSSYNKGVSGFKRTGIAKEYVRRVKKEESNVIKMFK